MLVHSVIEERMLCTCLFAQCLIPEVLRRMADQLQLPGVLYQIVRYLNPLPGCVVNQFVLVLVECMYQVWLARCAAACSSKVPDLREVLANVRNEVWFHLQRLRRFHGEQRFSERLVSALCDM